MERRSINESDSNALSFGLIIAALLLMGAIVELMLPAPHAEDLFAAYIAVDAAEIVSEMADEIAE